MFKPCNFTLDRLLEIHQEQRERNHARRQSAQSGARMKPGTADFLERYEAAIEDVLKRAIEIQKHHPEILENPQ